MSKKPFPAAAMAPAKPMPAPAAAPAASNQPVKAGAPASPMARAPVHPTQRLVPGVTTPRGVVRTDTHNAANQQIAPGLKHQGRGFKGD